MLKKFRILGFALAAFAVLAPGIAQTRVVRPPQGYVYRGGRWRPYRGFGHPYRGGYYDRWGRWHRFR